MQPEDTGSTPGRDIITLLGDRKVSVVVSGRGRGRDEPRARDKTVGRTSILAHPTSLRRGVTGPLLGSATSARGICLGTESYISYLAVSNLLTKITLMPKFQMTVPSSIVTSRTP
ncbi:hypothetical protein J6590_067214 [Homalodisca vitripennis]|nr:hypothetical protein J6590_067214 [Homalodisca vitripennis]